MAAVEIIVNFIIVSTALGETFVKLEEANDW
jgi:hypothetical protein